MSSKPLLQKDQALPISTNQLRFQSQIRRELLFAPEASNQQQTIKKKKAFTWKCGTGTDTLREFYKKFMVGGASAYAPLDFPFQSMTRAMKSDRNVQKLQLYYLQDLQRSDKGLSFVAQTLKQLPYLKSLSLLFTNLRSGRGFYQFSKQLNNLFHLQTLRLFFRSCRSMTDEALSCLNQSIRKLSLIEELELDFIECHITDTGLRNIRQCLKSLTHLKRLRLSFTSCLITDTGLYEIAKSIKNLQCLQNLRIILASLPHINDTGIQHLSESLKSLIKIQSICLSWPFCQRVTETSLVTLGENLKCLKTVKSIELEFSYCSTTDKGIDAFSKNLKELGSLERISLGFSNNDRITDKGLELLGLNLKEVVSLKEVFLQFYRCPQVGKDGRNQILKNMKKHVKVQVDGCAGPNEKQANRNRFFVFLLGFGLIFSLIISDLRAWGNGSLSWMSIFQSFVILAMIFVFLLSIF